MNLTTRYLITRKAGPSGVMGLPMARRATNALV